MKILIITDKYGCVEGVNQVINSDINFIVSSGFGKVSVISREPIGKDVYPGINKYYVPELALGAIENNLQGVAYILEEEKPDIVHFHLFKCSNNGDAKLISNLRKGYKTVFTVHDHILTCPVIKKINNRTSQPCNYNGGVTCLLKTYSQGCLGRNPFRAYKFLKPFLLRRSAIKKIDRYVVLNEYMKNSLVKAGFDSEKISVIPPACKYADDKKIKEGKKQNIILYVGKLVPEKGPQTLLRASAKIDITYKVIIVGDGWFRAELEGLARELKIGDRVSFLGVQNTQQLRRLYQKAKVLVIPSIIPESFCLVGLESLFFQVPVVAFDVGSVSAWLKDGENGFLVKPGSTNELAEKTELILKNEGMRKELGHNGNIYVKEKYSEEKYQNNMCALYENLL